MRPRILLAALFDETHTFLRDVTSWSDMEVTRGAEILGKEGDGSPTDGFLASARGFGWEVVPTISAFGPTGGPIEDAAFERFWREFRELAISAANSRLDGIFLVLHGAMATQSIPDAEGEFLSRLRRIPSMADVPVFGTLDLHANLTARMCTHANGLVAYRKNPHTDGKLTGIRAATLLERCLQLAQKPRMVWCRVPLVLAPPATGTQSDPMYSLSRMAENIESADSAVWAYNVVPGFSFADTPDSGLTLAAVTVAEPQGVRSHLQTVADLAWKLRDTGSVNFASPSDILARVSADPRGPILLVEPADNIGGGAPGDGTSIMRAFLAAGTERALVAINDPGAVQELAGVALGHSVHLAIGGRGWASDPGPVEVTAALVSRGSGMFRFEDPLNHMASATGAGYDMGPTAVVRVAGVTVLLTSKRTPPFDLGQFRSQEIDPEKYQWIGIKAAVGHRQAYDPIAVASFYVDTPGPCSSNLAQLPYRHLRRPVYPLDPIEVPEFRYS
jgi:microcystin degradation protein MlrC